MVINNYEDHSQSPKVVKRTSIRIYQRYYKCTTPLVHNNSHPFHHNTPHPTPPPQKNNNNKKCMKLGSAVM